MVAPILPIIAGAGYLGGSILNGIYSYSRNAETEKYWRTYYKNTGIRPIYPYRVGRYYDYSSYLYDIGRIGIGSYFGKKTWHKYTKGWR